MQQPMTGLVHTEAASEVNASTSAVLACLSAYHFQDRITLSRPSSGIVLSSHAYRYS